jgi:hypothetical protein
MALTAEQRDVIVTERLLGAPVRAIARQTGHSSATITKVWKEYCAANAEDRSDQITAIRDNLVFQLEEMAFVARLESDKHRRAGEWRAHVAYMRQEQSLRDRIARLTGADAPLVVEHNGDITVGVELSWREKQQALADYAAELCRQSQN